MTKRLIRMERHRLGPRLFLLGWRVHEYHVGSALLALSATVSIEASAHSVASVAALGGLWLVVKDWPDLFKATRDKASWRLGVHRLPPGEARELAIRCRDRSLAWFLGDVHRAA